MIMKNGRKNKNRCEKEGGMEKGKRIYFFVIMILVLMASPGELFAQAPGGKVLKMGVSATLTGPASYLGWHDKNGAILAAEEINERGGIRLRGEMYKLELEFFDNETKPAKGVEGMRMFAEKAMHVCAGPQLTPLAYAVMKFNEELKVLFGAYSTTPEVFEQGNKLILSATMNQKWSIGLSAFTAANVLNVKKAALLLDTTGYGRSIEKHFTANFKKFGGEVIAAEWYELKSTDFYPQLTRLKAKNPEAIMFGGMAAEAVTLIRQSREILGKKVLLIGSDYFKMDQLKKAGLEVSENTLVPLSGFHIINTKARHDFFRKFKDRFGAEPETYAACVHDEVLWLSRAMEMAGTEKDVFKVREAADPAMRELETQERLIGGAHGGFLPSGQAKKYYISTNVLREGKLVRLKMITDLKEIGLE
jgi:ABC-type branched-subunit amino acid transport system substrate-binding protein